MCRKICLLHYQRNLLMKMEDQAKDGGRETGEEPPRKKTKEAQQNVNVVTGCAGGTVGTSYTAATNYGWMGNKIVNEPDQQKKLFERTKKEIDLKIAGMVRVSALDVVVNKMNTGQHWITITGNAGDGKTTLGYLVLKEFLKKNVKVFTIYKPEEYDQIADIEEDSVIMFDDRFGAFLADQKLINNWLDVIRKIFNFKENDKTKTHIIFVGRKNVMNESRMNLGQLTENIFDLKCVVDLSERNIPEERLNILEYHLEREHVTVDHELKRKVSNKNIAHGFPHCCKLYSMLRKNFNVDIEEFFESPLKFLDWTTTVLYKDNCKDLFRMMIKNDGAFDVYTIEDENRRHALLQVEKEQEGSYITVWRNGICHFAHPSVYESVLNVINDIDPLYCVQYAPLSVIRQKMLISTSDEEDRNRAPCYIIVKPIPKVLAALEKRFRGEILEGDYSVFTQRLCESREFCEVLVSCSTHKYYKKNKRSINQPGEDGKTMLWTAVKSGLMTAIQVLVKAGADVNIHDERWRTPLYHLCELKYSTAADYNQQRVVNDTIRLIVTEGKGDVNIQVERGRTALHYLVLVKNSASDEDHQREVMDTIRLFITEGRGDVNIRDQCGHTPLHYLFKCQPLTAGDITWLITEGKGDLSQCEQNKSTPLHYLCAYSGLQPDTVDVVIREGRGDFNKGDEHGSTPLHYVCANTNVGFNVVLQIVNTAKGDINKRDDNGITPLHVLCRGSLQIKDILTLIHQEDKADMYGNTPLHFLCRRQGISAVVLQQQLKQIPEADMKKENALGYTPLDYLTDEDDSLPWRDGMIERSPDLVLCRLKQGDRWIVVKAPAMTLSSERVYEDLQVEDFNKELTNMALSGDRDRPNQFRWFFGTCSSPVPVPLSPSPFSLPTYWETHSSQTWREGIGPLLQIGVVEEDYLDAWLCVSHLPRSVCVSVEGGCPRHDDHPCIKVWRGPDQGDRKDQVGQCVTLPLPTSFEEITFKFGLVLDVGRGRVGFIDVERGEILGKVDQIFTERVFPMFFVRPSAGSPTRSRVRLVSGREISLNDRKIQLIQEVLSD